ncbi:MAG: 30S ribosomal protein S27ae [Candidatus Woesearchaeota archaeon]
MADKKGRWNNYKVEGDALVCLNEFSPKSDVARMMANHKDRKTCGKTGYTEFSKSE